MRLSIIIVNWNSKDYLRKCLESLAEQDQEIDKQVIVVDGGSFDGCDSMVAHEFPYVQFVQSKENIGFGRSNNLGADQADGEYLLLLNPDTEILPGALSNLAAAFAQLPNAGIAGARLLNSDGTLQTSSVHAAPTPLNQALGSEFLMRRFPKSRLWKSYDAYRSDQPTPVEAVSGACMFMPTALFRSVGGFTPTYFMYAEDMDLCLKVKRAGYEIYHVPKAEILHHGGGSSSTQFSKFSSVMMKEALYQYMLINHGVMRAARFRVFMAGSALARLAAISVAAKSGNSTTSKLKWKAVLSWAFGKETWTEKYSATPKQKRAPTASASA